MRISYLDNAATTPLCDSAREEMIKSMDLFGNPSSLHKLGIESSKALDFARKTIADSIKATKQEIYFTSGGTEADNMAVFGGATAMARRGNRIITTAVEHSAVMESMKHLESKGFEVVYLTPDENGVITEEQFIEHIDEKTILVSCMYVNNEVGSVFPVDKIKRIIDRANSPALFHIDAVQAYGKYQINATRLGADLITISAHKIHGPKGIGALYVRKGVRINQRIFGGEQESGLRPGTESLTLIAGFSAAVKEICDLREREEKAKEIKEYITEKLTVFPDVKINSGSNSCPYLLNLSVTGIRSETMLHFLEERGVYVSSGSACAKGAPSHVLKAMGLNPKEADSAIRISLSHQNTKEDADALIEGVTLAREKLIRARGKI